MKTIVKLDFESIRDEIVFIELLEKLNILYIIINNSVCVSFPDLQFRVPDLLDRKIIKVEEVTEDGNLVNDERRKINLGWFTTNTQTILNSKYNIGAQFSWISGRISIRNQDSYVSSSLNDLCNGYNKNMPKKISLSALGVMNDRGYLEIMEQKFCPGLISFYERERDELIRVLRKTYSNLMP